MPEAQLAPTFQALSAEQRKKLFEVEHPAYKAKKDTWQLGLDAYDGDGGFATGDYLDRYPREEESKFRERKVKARYHNYVETIVDMYVRKIFSQKIARDTTDEGLQQFWADVTGGGVDMSSFMAEACGKSLAAGHMGILVDKSRDEASGPAKADEKAVPFLTQYLSTELQDWRTKDDRTTLTFVKLREAKPSADPFSDHATGDDAIRMLIWNTTEWARVEKDPSVAVEAAIHSLDQVPFVILAPKPSKTWPLTGKPLVGNPNIIKAMFNRCSEEDEVLRDQAFSLFTVDVGESGDVEATKQQIGGEVGTTRAIVLKGKAQYLTPDQNVPEAIRKNIAYLVQEIYRMAHMRFQRDSLEAESAEALQLKHDELNATLASVAEACQEAEIEIAKLYFAWSSATPEAADQAFEAAAVNVTYATEFFLQDLEQELKAWVLAVKQQLGKTMEQRVKMRIVKRLEPDLDAKTLHEIEKEIEAIANEPKPDITGIADQLRANAAGRMANFARQAGEPPPPQPGEGEAAA
jgi:hypothetical protein